MIKIVDWRLIAASAVLLVGSTSCSSVEGQGFFLKCEFLAMAAASLQTTTHYHVPPGEAASYNEAVVTYLRDSGYTYITGASDNHLTAPDDMGVQKPYLNIQSVGCTSEVVIWSENFYREERFHLNIHKTIFGSSKDALKVKNSLAEKLARWKQIEPEF